MMKVTVLMSTYNGHKYIREQIDSILNQKDVEVQLIIRDDGSKDNTVKILEEYSARYANVKWYTGKNLGATYSFLDLVRQAPESPYYAFADQDDNWEQDKLIVAVNSLEKLDSSKPLLYYSNLNVVDENLNFIRLSHTESKYQKNKYSCLVDYVATGCTMVFNSEAKKYINMQTPQWTTMHDIWIYMICKMFGEVVYDPEPHINYRIHGDNVIGTYKKKTLSLYLKHFVRIFHTDQNPKLDNVKSFYECYGEMLGEKDKEKVLEVLNYKNSAKDTLKLLFDKDLKSQNLSREFRNKILIILHTF